VGTIKLPEPLKEACMDTMKDAIAFLAEGRNLLPSQMERSMESIMEGQATPAQIGAFLMGLRVKGETSAEVSAAARIMRQKAVRLDCRANTVLDTCGTGGDGKNTFNISTAAAIVAAGAGAIVAKHGNRSVSSLCGSADVLAELGVNLDAEPDLVEECISEIGIGFLFAPKLHPAMKHAIGPRKDMGIRTLFNLLGPLSNPAGASAQLLGVFHPTLTETFARVLADLGSRHAMVVHGLDGLDEITIAGPTRVCELKDGAIRTYNLDPEPYVDRLARTDDLEGGDAVENARIIQGILKGESGPRRDVTVLNAGAALVVAGKAADLREGVEAASRSIDVGLAREKLEALVEMSNS